MRPGVKVASRVLPLLLAHSFERALPEQAFRGDVPVLNIRHKHRIASPLKRGVVEATASARGTTRYLRSFLEISDRARPTCRSEARRSGAGNGLDFVPEAIDPLPVPQAFECEEARLAAGPILDTKDVRLTALIDGVDDLPFSVFILCYVQI
jgi:hypothetical protein